MARPESKIDREKFEMLCAVQCTQAEICGQLDVDDKTLTKWCKKTYGKHFSEVFKLKKGKGTVSLRKRGFSMAHEIPSVHIFYAKNFLGMTDKPNADTGEIVLKTISNIAEILSKRDPEALKILAKNFDHIINELQSKTD
jgi:hypothetical protein